MRYPAEGRLGRTHIVNSSPATAHTAPLADWQRTCPPRPHTGCRDRRGQRGGLPATRGGLMRCEMRRGGRASVRTVHLDADLDVVLGGVGYTWMRGQLGRGGTK